ncbi:MAG: hypothetical protein BWX74_00147 [Tenericutes bacterium ADurb.Bin087]|nr:MAG: hypothetical protein BWX74_00147 [Tenericutes bacterium ADurb.Bin087]
MKCKKWLPLSFIFLVITSCDRDVKISEQKANIAVFAAKEKSQFHNFDAVNFTYIGEELRGQVVYNRDKTTESEFVNFSLDVKACATDIAKDELKMAVNYIYYVPSEDDETVFEPLYTRDNYYTDEWFYTKKESIPPPTNAGSTNELNKKLKCKMGKLPATDVLYFFNNYYGSLLLERTPRGIAEYPGFLSIVNSVKTRKTEDKLVVTYTMSKEELAFLLQASFGKNIDEMTSEEIEWYKTHPWYSENIERTLNGLNLIRHTTTIEIDNEGLISRVTNDISYTVTYYETTHTIIEKTTRHYKFKNEANFVFNDETTIIFPEFIDYIDLTNIYYPNNI